MLSASVRSTLAASPQSSRVENRCSRFALRRTRCPRSQAQPFRTSALKRRLIALPLLLQLRHESDEPLILSQAVQVGIVLKQRITGEAIVGGELKPFKCLVRFVEQRIGRSNVVSRVMEMLETLPDVDRSLDHLFRFTFLARFGQEHRLNAGHIAALLARVW